VFRSWFFLFRVLCFVLRSSFFFLCKAHAGSLLDQCREERGPTWAWMCEGLCSSTHNDHDPHHDPHHDPYHEPERMSTATEMRFYGNNGHATPANAATDLSQHDPSKVGLCCCCYCIGDGRWCLLLLLPTVASCSMLIRVLFCFIALFLHRCRSIAGCFSNSAAKTKI
jgi:hypothetical protein